MRRAIKPVLAAAIALAGTLSAGAAAAAAPPPPVVVAGPVVVTPAAQSFFMEPYLVANSDGIVIAAIGKDPALSANDNTVVIHRQGWTCRSDDGAAWSCQEVQRPAGVIDFADPWLADSRGSACPAYGGITMVALEGSGIGPRQYLQPVAYTTLDDGRTWSGPVTIPSFYAVADGTKTEYTGQLYAAWRDFFFASGASVSRLGSGSDPCVWAEPTLVPDGHDHPRLAPGTTRGGVAYRGSAGTAVMTFHQYDPDMLPSQAPTPVGATTPLSLLTQLCDSANGHCFAAYDIGQTLVKGDGQDYYTVWLDRPTGGPADRQHAVVRFSVSHDGGLTWSAPTVVAGAGGDASTAGSAAWMPELSYDHATGTLAAAYIERDSPDQRLASVRVRVFRDGEWSAPTTVGTTLTYMSNTNTHLGDYFGLQATDGVIHLAWQDVTDESGLARIDYVRLGE